MLTVAHSPDTDDFFLFWAIVEGRIDCEGLEFAFRQYDTATLNELAVEGKYDIVAVSAAAYRQLQDTYLILPHGASVGRNYGPVVVSQRKLSIDDLNEATVAIPGATTTSAAVFKKIAPQANCVEVPIEPFKLVFDYLNRGEVDAALLIHEGQISYRSRDLHKVVDIGNWWQERFSLPLPLGINVIKRSIGDETIERASRVLSRSIAYGLAHRDEVLGELIQLNNSREADLTSQSGVKEYLERYANADTARMDEDCIEALRILLGSEVELAFAP
ncbi:MAG: hypothetical protein KDD66_06950 [Bdellovibrionales bacterium]|nr:hypothetical protein [Bdellovibrionales bacterium]